MKTLNKKFNAAFGEEYELQILSKKRIWDIVYDLNPEDVLVELIGKHLESGTTTAFLNVESGEVEYIFLIGNENLRREQHLINLEKLSGNIEEGLSIEDFLNEEEIEEVGQGEPWDKIKQLDDYSERLTDALKFHYQGFRMNDIEEQINEIY